MKEKFIKLVKSRDASGELSIVRDYHFGVNFENNIFKGIEEGEIRGISVRVKKDGKIGFSYAEGDARIEDVVDSAFDVLSYGENVDFDFVKALPPSNVRCFDRKIVDESRDEAIQNGKEFVDFVRNLKDGIKAGYSESKDVIYKEIVTTNGFSGSFDKTVKSVAVSAFYVEEGNFLDVYASQSRSVNEMFDLETLREKIKTDILAANRTAKISSGKYPVIFTPFSVNELFTPLIFALNGLNIYRGRSLLRGKLAKEVFSPNLTVVDNPTISGGAYSVPFDGEGVASERKELIAKGVVSNYLSDLYVSSRLKIAPGNAARTISYPPHPASSNIIIRPGDVPVKNMLNIKRGLLVESLMGVTMGNIVGGEVNGNVELGFLVENGKIVGRVKNTMIDLNIFEAFKDIALSQENIWLDKFISPYFYIPNVSVSAK